MKVGFGFLPIILLPDRDRLEAMPVDWPRILETTALGAAYLAGFQAGIYPVRAEFAEG